VGSFFPGSKIFGCYQVVPGVAAIKLSRGGSQQLTREADRCCKHDPRASLYQQPLSRALRQRLAVLLLGILDQVEPELVTVDPLRKSVLAFIDARQISQGVHDAV